MAAYARRSLDAVRSGTVRPDDGGPAVRATRRSLRTQDDPARQRGLLRRRLSQLRARRLADDAGNAALLDRHRAWWRDADGRHLELRVRTGAAPLGARHGDVLR